MVVVQTSLTAILGHAELPTSAPSCHLMCMPLHVPLPTYSVEDLEGFPDDGCRYELVNGILLVTPAPAHVHQATLARLMELLWRYLGDEPPARLTSPGVIQVAPSLHLEPDL